MDHLNETVTTAPHHPQATPSIPSLEEIICQQLAAQIKNAESEYFGENLPGFLDDLLPEDNALRSRMWELVALGTAHAQKDGDERDKDSALTRGTRGVTTIPKARPFFGSSNLLTFLTLKGLTNLLARELCPAHFPNLESLIITDSPKLTDIGLNLGPARFPNGMKLVSIKRCPQVTWKGVSSLPASNGLEIADSMLNNSVPRADELFPPSCPRCSLTFDDNGSRLDGVASGLYTALSSGIAATRNLTELVYNKNLKVNDALARACANAISLRSITFSFSGVTSEGLSSLRNVATLESLDLSYSSIRFRIGEHYEDAAFWNAFVSLTSLDLSGTDFGADNSAILTAIHQGCPKLVKFVARNAHLKNISGEASAAMYRKLTVLDLSGNKYLGDELFEVPADIASMVQTLDLSATAIQHPIALLENPNAWPFLNVLRLNFTDLSRNFLVQLLGSSDTNPNTIKSISLRHCKAVTDAVILRIQHQRGFRRELESLDFTGCALTPDVLFWLSDELIKARSQLKLRPCLSTITEAFRGEDYMNELIRTVELDVNRGQGEENADEEEGYTSDSSIESDALERFVRSTEGAPGTEKSSIGQTDGVSASSLTQEQFINDMETDDHHQQEKLELKQDLLRSCCHCEACAIAHPQTILFPKLRYSKDQLLAMRNASTAVATSVNS